MALIFHLEFVAGQAAGDHFVARAVDQAGDLMEGLPRRAQAGEMAFRHAAVGMFDPHRRTRDTVDQMQHGKIRAISATIWPGHMS